MCMHSLVRSINPLERELRQNGLFSFEKSMLKQLRGRGWIRSPFSITLPYEIWAMILHLVVAPLVDPSAECNFRTFPQYQLHFSHYEGLYRKDWASMRLVCRAWEDLLGHGPYTVMYSSKTRGNSPEIAVPKGTKSLFIQWGYLEAPLLLKNLIADPRMSNSIVTLALGSNLCPVGHASVEILLQGDAINFPSLRYLALGWWPPNSSPPLSNFWRRIGRKFPQLISLTLKPFILVTPGRISLPKLQILDFHPDGRNNVVYNFPSLKHCSVHDVVQLDRILWSCSRNLESLIINRGGVELNTAFWKKYPRLRMLGITISADSFDITNFPPPNHPLSHLQLRTPPSWKGDRVKVIKDALTYFPNVMFVSIDENIKLTRKGLIQHPDLQILPVPLPDWAKPKGPPLLLYIEECLESCVFVLLQLLKVCLNFVTRSRRKRPPIHLGP
ncbi:hypothetical protein CPB86DRAFT_779747 [Serendipita vermifera]|nr:hypothetical protein CPB86DRAFT_779747 [Serendipita vermifera]